MEAKCHYTIRVKAKNLAGIYSNEIEHTVLKTDKGSIPHMTISGPASIPATKGLSLKARPFVPKCQQYNMTGEYKVGMHHTYILDSLSYISQM